MGEQNVASEGVVATGEAKGRKNPEESMGRAHHNISREGALPQGCTTGLSGAFNLLEERG